MRELTEIRWHARAGQGAKTAAQVLARASLDAGKSAQAFPEYGPERRGAPLRAFTRISSAPIRRHDSVTEPDLVVVLEPSLADDPAVREGVTPDCVVLANGERPAGPSRGTRWVPAARLAAEGGSGFVNLVMLGAAAAALGEPALEAVQSAAVETLGEKVSAEDVREAVAKGYEWPS